MFKWLTYDEVMQFAVDHVSNGPTWDTYPSVPWQWLGEKVQLETALRLAVELARAQGVHPMPKEEEVQQLATVSVEEAYAKAPPIGEHYESRLDAYIEEGW